MSSDRGCGDAAAATSRACSSPLTPITSFAAEHRFLSNFAAVPADYEGVQYPTAEHAFAAAKTLNLAERRHVARVSTPGEAKRLGRELTLRPGWDEVVRFDAMGQIVASKFSVVDPR